MKRRLFHSSAFVSLTLGVMVVVLWVRSYWWVDTVRWNGQRCVWRYAHDCGVISFRWGPQLIVEREDPQALSVSSLRLARPAWGSSFALIRDDHEWDEVHFPHWILALAAAPLPASWLLWRWRRTRNLNKLCPGCGYDLRGTLGSTCPECGALPGGVA